MRDTIEQCVYIRCTYCSMVGTAYVGQSWTGHNDALIRSERGSIVGSKNERRSTVYNECIRLW